MSFPNGNPNGSVPNGTNPTPNGSQVNNPNAANNSPGAAPTVIGGGRFDFDDGGTYCGGWHDGKAHGHGICTGPKGQGEYSGSWHYGFEVSGIYKWPSGATYEGQWQNGKRHGIGVEYRGKWVYKGEWTQGYKGRYGIRASLLSNARYEGTWANGLQDGYGSETYADGGTYQGQWLRGMRHGYGARTSAPYGHSTITKMANNQQNQLNPHSSLHSLDTEGEDPGAHQAEHRDAVRGGFVLVARVSPNQHSSSKRRNSLVEKTTSTSSLTGGFLKGLRLRKQRSTGDLDVRSQRNTKSMTPSLRSSREGSETGSTGSRTGDLQASQAELGSNASFLSQNGDISDPATVETYFGEWKNDKRAGFGICERTDGLKYEGEWYNNKKYGYGVTTFPDGTREEGKYKNNQLVTNIRKKHLFMMRSSKLRERIESAVVAAARAQQIALQKSDIAASRTATARVKSEQADYAASTAQNDSQMAIIIAKQYGGGSMASHGQGSIAPLRRRLSDFSQVRRMRDGQPGNFDANPNNPNQPQANRQFLDPNEPFGGRRGSFRTQMLTQDGHPPMGHSQMGHNQMGHNQMGHNQMGHNQMGHNQMGPNQIGHNPIGSPQPQMYPNLQSQQYQQQFSHHNPNFGYQPMGSPQSNRYMFSQQPPTGMSSPNAQMNPKDPFSQAFSDHFDHYAMMRGGTPTTTASRYLPNSRIPSNMGSNSQISMVPSMSPSPVPSQYPPSTSTYSANPSPIPCQSKPPIASMANNFSRPPSSNTNIQSIPPMSKVRNRMNINNPNAIDYSVDESHQQQAEAAQDEGVRRLRTASLYRPGTQQPSTSSGASGGGSSGGGFKRKPSLQANVTKQVNKPVMSREEVSVLSHQQREHRRVEQEYRERLSHNPLLYLWSPGLIAWLNRQKFVILVFFINVFIAYLFVRMIL